MGCAVVRAAVSGGGTVFFIVSAFTSGTLFSAAGLGFLIKKYQTTVPINPKPIMVAAISNPFVLLPSVFLVSDAKEISGFTLASFNAAGVFSSFAWKVLPLHALVFATNMLLHSNLHRRINLLLFSYYCYSLLTLPIIAKNPRKIKDKVFTQKQYRPESRWRDLGGISLIFNS